MTNSYIVIASSSSSSLLPTIDPIGDCHRFVAVFSSTTVFQFFLFLSTSTHVHASEIHHIHTRIHTHTHAHTHTRTHTSKVRNSSSQQDLTSAKVQHAIFSTSLATGRPSWAFHWHRRFPHQRDLWHHQAWQRCSSSPSPCWFGKTSAKTQQAKEMLSVLVFT